MIKLLNTLYITKDDVYLSLEGESIVITQKGQEIFRQPLLNINDVVCFNYLGASPRLMQHCTDNNIGITFLNPYGKFLARVSGKIRGNVLLRREQFRIADDSRKRTHFAKHFIAGKLINCKNIIDRAVRDYADRIDIASLKSASTRIKENVKNLLEVDDNANVRGIEGESAKIYFDALDNLILQQKEGFFFKERSRRPPLDNFNSLLSFLYVMLSINVQSALETVGLDPYVGFLHTDRPGRASLALDMMEELRPIFADRIALSLVNNRQINAKGFDTRESGEVIIKDDTRKKILDVLQTRKNEEIVHPFLKEKVKIGLLPYIQAMLLARCIRDEIEDYPFFVYK